MEMKLENSLISVEEYVCDVTRELDKLAGVDKYDNDWYHHYIYVDSSYLKNKCLPIRIPGGTLGGLYFNDNFEITKIVVDTDYVVRTYHTDVNEQIKKFLGSRLEFKGGKYFS